jgi:hypothetical protein
LVEQLIYTEKVGGSSPSSPTKMYSRHHSFEDRGNIPNRHESALPSHLEKLYSQIKEKLDSDAIKPAEFVELYGFQNVEADLDYVNQKKAEFERNNSPENVTTNKYATIFEGVIHTFGNEGHWFGPHSTMQKASEFDDIKHGVDSIVEFQPPRQPASQLALAIDVTFAQDLRRKFDRISDEIEQGKLTEIKYFNSETTGFKGKKTKVPRVVVGANIAIVKSLAELWVAGEKSRVANHPIQHLILKEAMMQAESFSSYAKKVGQQEISDIYQYNLQVLQTIFNSKRDRNMFLAEDDQVFKTIADLSGHLH